MGGQDSVRWHMLVWLWKTRDKAEGTRDLARRSGVPHVFCTGARELDALYAAWGLAR